MYGFLYRLGTWLATKLSVAILIVVLGLAAFGGWLFLRDHVLAESQREQHLEDLVRRRDQMVAQRAEIANAIVRLQEEAAVQRDRAQRAEKVIATLRELESWWERVFGNAEQQERNAQQAARMAELKDESGARLVQLQQELADSEKLLDRAQSELSGLEAEIRAVTASESEALHYLRAAWERARWYLLVALLTYFFGPTLVKLLAYFGLAPLLSSGKPIRFENDLRALPAVGPSRVSVDAELWPGEILRVKERYLQASDEHLTRKTRFVLDWRIPFTSLACGLIELVEMRNGRATGEARVTFSNAEDPHEELAVIAIPDGGSLILRPSFLVGVITPADQPVKINRRWVLFRWQSWVTLQFRYFEFAGPCRLVVAGSRGVRAERLVEREGLTRPARRTNQHATIGFTPNLDYLPVRAETFWGYYRDMNPLFDDLFAGQGLFVLQETSHRGEGAGVRRFWSDLWNGLLKVFGL